MKSKAKKVMVLQGSTVEVGQSLTNIYGENPEFEIIQHFTTQSVREIPQTILTAAAPQYEPILIIIIVYYNPTDLVGVEFSGTPQVKAKLTN
jgi:hypothetical protein